MSTVLRAQDLVKTTIRSITFGLRLSHIQPLSIHNLTMGQRSASKTDYYKKFCSNFFLVLFKSRPIFIRLISDSRCKDSSQAKKTATTMKK